MAHRRFFGCHESAGGELWSGGSVGMRDRVGFYMDADPRLESEIIRLYWLFATTRTPREGLPTTEPSGNAALLEYAVAASDFAKIDEAALDKQLGAAPFAGNDYARAVVRESVAVLKWRRQRFEQAIDKITRDDADYREIFLEAPKRAFAEWEKIFAPWQAELDRSMAFERKLSLPSPKALAGCVPELQKDAHKLIKSYKSKDYNELLDKTAADPIASLLLSRLAICYAAENVKGGAGAFRDLVKQGRDLRGPRSFAYYTMVDAITETLKTRPRPLVSLSSFPFESTTLVNIYGLDFTFSGGMSRAPERSGDSGTVKAVKKTADGLEVVFKAQKEKYPEYNCVSTNKPIRIAPDGTIEYQQNCKPTGKMTSVDRTPQPFAVSPLLAAEIKPGAYVVSSSGSVPYVKKKAAAREIMTFFGFTL